MKKNYKTNLTRAERIVRSIKREMTLEREEQLKEEIRDTLEMLDEAKLQVSKLERRLDNITNKIDSNLI